MSPKPILVCVLIAAVLGSALAAAETIAARPVLDPAPTGERALRARILATTSLRGEWESCTCKDAPLGGVSQAMAVVADARHGSSPTFFFDAGDRLFDIDMALPQRLEAERRIDALLLVDAANVGGLDAAGVGPLDLVMGVEYLQKLGVRQRAPLLSANLYEPGGERLFAPHLVIERGGVRVGVTSVAPATVEGPGVVARNPMAEARAAVSALRKQQVDAVVILSTLGEDGDRALARTTGATLVIGASSREVRADGLRVGHSWLAEAGSRGRYLVDARLYAEGQGNGPHTIVTVLPVPRDGARHPQVEALVEDATRRRDDPFLGTSPVRLSTEDAP